MVEFFYKPALKRLVEDLDAKKDYQGLLEARGFQDYTAIHELNAERIQDLLQVQKQTFAEGLALVRDGSFGWPVLPQHVAAPAK